MESRSRIHKLTSSILIIILSLQFLGCGSSYVSTDVLEDNLGVNAVSGESLSVDDAASGAAVSGMSADVDISDDNDMSVMDGRSYIDDYVSRSFTPEILSQIRYLSRHQKLWCDEVVTGDEYVNSYAVTDMDHDGRLEIAQKIDLQYIYYTEITGEDGDYKLEPVKRFPIQDYVMGVLVEGDQSEGYVINESPSEILDGNDFRPRTEARWALSYISGEVSRIELPGGKHLTCDSTLNIAFTGHIVLRLDSKVKNQNMLYNALRASLESFYTDDAISYVVRNNLVRLSKGYDGLEIPEDAPSMAVTDFDDDYVPEILICKAGLSYGQSDRQGVFTGDEGDDITVYTFSDGSLRDNDMDLSGYAHDDRSMISVLDMIWVDNTDESLRDSLMLKTSGFSTSTPDGRDDTDDQAEIVPDISESIGRAYMKYAVWKTCVGLEQISADTYPIYLFSGVDIGNPMLMNHYFGFITD